MKIISIIYHEKLADFRGNDSSFSGIGARGSRLIRSNVRSAMFELEER